MTECYQTSMNLPRVKRRNIEVNFDGGEVTSDGGTLLLRQLDRTIGLTKALDKAIEDPRVQAKWEHSQLSMLRQRIYGMAAGYEDLIDHDLLRHDTAFQTAVESERELSTSPTLYRLEQRADRETAIKLHQVLIEQFFTQVSEFKFCRIALSRAGYRFPGPSEAWIPTPSVQG